MPTTTLLENTNEYIHASVRSRFGREGLGIEDRGPYKPLSLREWVLTRAKDDEELSSGQPGYAWVYDPSDTKLAFSRGDLSEDVLGDLELKLLQHFPESYEKVMGFPVPNRDELISI